MIISLCICIVSFVALAIMLGYRMYSKAEVEREVKHAELVLAQIGKNAVRSVKSIDRDKVQRAYHWFLEKIERAAHAVAARIREIFHK